LADRDFWTPNIRIIRALNSNVDEFRIYAPHTDIDVIDVSA